MTTKEQFQVFENNTDIADGTWKIGSLTGLFFNWTLELASYLSDAPWPAN